MIDKVGKIIKLIRQKVFQAEQNYEYQSQMACLGRKSGSMGLERIKHQEKDMGVDEH